MISVSNATKVNTQAQKMDAMALDGRAMSSTTEPIEYGKNANAVATQTQCLPISAKTRITHEQVAMIRKLRAQGLKMKEIAPIVNLTKAQVIYWLNPLQRSEYARQFRLRCPRCKNETYRRNEAGLKECKNCGYCPAALSCDMV